MISEDTLKFIDVLDSLVENYNNTPHASLGDKTPNQAHKNTGLQNRLREKAKKHNRKLLQRIDLDIGDYVRRSVDKSKFEKEKAKF